MKIIVIGKAPKTLKLTQKLSEKLRHITSLINAIVKKYIENLKDNFSQSSSFMVKAVPITSFIKDFLLIYPTYKIRLNTVYTMVGFILIYIGFPLNRVIKPDKINIAPEIINGIESRLSII